jgi:hypothetical protein
MKANIQNVAGESLSRLDGLREAMDALLAEAASLAPLLPVDDESTELSVFACAYGLTIPGVQVCDLFRLMDMLLRIGQDPELIACKDHLSSEYERRIRVNPVSMAIEVMGSEAYRLRSMARAEAETIVRARIEQNIKQELLAKSAQHLKKELESRMRQEGAEFLSLDALSERWQGLRTGISGSNEFLGGATPMRQCLEMTEAILQDRLKSAPAGSRFILFIGSDGDSTDGDPRPVAVRLSEQGVQIISCFVSSTDVVQGKNLFTDKGADWPDGAKTMFDLSSPVARGSAEFKYLENEGWKVTTRGWRGLMHRVLVGPFEDNTPVKLFAQVNHSALLSEFLRVVLAPLYAESRSA